AVDEELRDHGTLSALRDARGRSTARVRLLRADLDGIDLGARPYLLHAVEDDALARSQAGVDEPIVADHPRSRNHTLGHAGVVADHEHDRVAALVARDAALRHEQRLALHRLCELRAHEHPGQELALRIREQRAQHHGASARIHRYLGELQLAVVLRAL